MNYLSSKEEIKTYLRKNFIDLNKITSLNKFTTQEISKELNFSRSLISQHLNELVKEHEAIKIISRPVYYLDKKMIEEKYCVTLKRFEFLSINELIDYVIKNNSNIMDFHKFIGYETTFEYVINQIKSAMSYPDNLPIILYGEKGTGKNKLIELAYEYCVNNNIIERKLPLYKYNVYKDIDDNKILDELFNVENGFFTKAKNSMLMIKNADNLSYYVQEKISEHLSLMQNNFNEFKKDEKIKIIFSMKQNPNKVLNKSFLLNIPIICFLPSLNERSQDEKRKFVLKFLKNEENNLNKKIRITERTLNILMEYNYENNIDELNLCIKNLCANSYNKHKNDIYNDLSIHNLPVQILENISIKNNFEDERLLFLEELEANKKEDFIIKIYEELLSLFEVNKHNIADFLNDYNKVLRSYYDLLFFEKSYFDSKHKTIEKSIELILENFKNSKNINIPFNCSSLLAKMLLKSQNYSSSLMVWEKDNKKDIENCLENLKELLNDEYIVTEMISKNIEYNLNLKLSYINQIFLLLNINFYNKNLKTQNTAGIILSHGYSTASSIADAANTLLKTFIFEALDMPLDTNIKQISNKLNKFIIENSHFKNLILLVDMGSLEEIGNVITKNINVGIINNISTSLALNVGYKILQGLDLNDILEKSCKEAFCHYKILPATQKDKAIIFTNDVDILVAEKLHRLFKDSLPKNIDLKMFEYDFNTLMKNKENDYIFKKYDVVLMVSPDKLKIVGVDSVSLDQIINFEGIKKIENILKPYLTKTEIEFFNQTLLKNFSMQSLLENLTILNAPKLLDYVSDFINSLQHYLKMKFKSKTVVSIYIHTCLLVERLVTKNGIESYQNIKEFEIEHKDFIEYTKKSFSAMLAYYNVQIPLSEIAYLYDFIKHDKEANGYEEDF